ncbi:putative aspartic-type [Phaeomoniella chlamydospora]|uniref:Putative aspartic-type n=1 Tax=Phaeomoniella chlamydospora TaxID=158046 RepID=A0A0G2EMW1_PHACM|nr:putative aspartic-type [Phaeomoniella chlamydospora]
MRSLIFIAVSLCLSLATANSSPLKLAKRSSSLPQKRASLVPRSSFDSETESILSLTRAKGTSVSSGYLNRLRLDKSNHTVQLNDTQLGEIFISAISFGNQSFDAIVDTGSSDTWLVEAGFTCVDPETNATITEAECYFGAYYYPDSTVQFITDENFNITYADGEYLNGYMAYETVTLANITVTNQEVGIVNLAGWNGDGISSGLIGLAYPDLTSAYAGTNATADSYDEALTYDPIFTTMYKRNLTAPYFSLALSRDESQSGNGGLMAIGGIPCNIPGGIQSPFTSTPIETLRTDFRKGSNYYYYTINPYGFSFTTNKTLDPTSLNQTFIVDSGTTLNYIPTTSAATFNSLFSPPAFLDEGYYYVSCNATAPSFNVYITSNTSAYYPTNPYDLILDIDEGDICLSGVQDGGEPGDGNVFILGDVFLKNVLAVFDVGNEEMRFAKREFYDS